MQQDYEKHKEDEKYEFPMTDAYFPTTEGIVPVDYGIIVVDQINKVILSNQCYSNISYYNIKRDMDASDLEQLKLYLSENRLKDYHTIRRSNIKILPNNNEEIINAIVKSDLLGYFKLDLYPYTIEEYEKWDTTYKRVKELGFTISEEDDKDWNERIEYQKEDD